MPKIRRDLAERKAGKKSRANLYFFSTMQKDKLTEDLFIYQNDKLFRYGIDAVLLAHFGRNLRGRVIDIGTGTGILPLLLSPSKKISEIVGLELQEEALELARRSVEENGLQEKIQLISGDLMKIDELFIRESFDGLLCNPPYFEKGHGLTCKDKARNLSRSEEAMTLEGLLRAMNYLLKPKAPLYMIYRPRRLGELLRGLTEFDLEPKTLRFVHPRPNKEANLFLLEAVKGGGRQCRVLEPLFVYDALGYSAQTLSIYEEMRMG